MMMMIIIIIVVITLLCKHRETAEPDRIDILLGVEIFWDPKNIVLDGERMGIRCGLRQITLTTCLTEMQSL